MAYSVPVISNKLHMGRTLLIATGFFGGAVIVILLINLVGLGIGFAWLPFYKFGSKLNYTQSTVNTVYNAQRCINVNATYEAFKTNIPAIQNEQIPNAEAALKSYESKLPSNQTTWSIEEQQSDAELQTNLTGLQQQLSQLQAQYTAFISRPDTQPCLGKLPTLINLN